MPFFLTLRSVQTLSDPKVIDRIKKKFFGATTIIRKIFFGGRIVVVDGVSDNGAISGASSSGSVTGCYTGRTSQYIFLPSLIAKLRFLSLFLLFRLPVLRRGHVVLGSDEYRIAVAATILLKCAGKF